MLSETQIKAIAGLIKIDPAKLTEAIKDEREVSLEISDKLTVLDEEGLKRVKDEEYKNGKEAGVEMDVKKVKEEMKLDFQGKSIKGLIDAATAKAIADAKIEPNEKVKTLEADLQTLRATTQTLQQQLTEKDKAVSSASTERELFKQLPSLGDNAPDVDTVVMLMKANGYGFDLVDGKLVATKDGAQLKDNVANLIPVKDVITGFAKEKKLIKEDFVPGGRGGGDKTKPVSFTKLSEVVTHYKDQGKSTQGEEFMNHVQKLQAENKDFILD